jgi:hypothetical protein
MQQVKTNNYFLASYRLRTIINFQYFIVEFSKVFSVIGFMEVITIKMFLNSYVFA